MKWALGIGGLVVWWGLAYVVTDWCTTESQLAAQRSFIVWNVVLFLELIPGIAVSRAFSTLRTTLRETA